MTIFRNLTILAALLGSAAADRPALADDGPPAPSQIDLAEFQSIYDRILPDLERGRRPPAADQLMMILFATSSDPLPGWYGPGRSRYDWTWVAATYDANRDGRVTREEFRGSDAVWAQLDRDRDGQATRGDMDWSDASPWMRHHTLARLSFRVLDANQDGRLSEAEWSAHYRKLARGGGEVGLDAYRDALYPPVDTSHIAPATPAQRMNRVKGLLSGDHGALTEGPEVGALAPDFTLRTHDGGGTVTLSAFRGKRPVVLTFGSFTCGSYRSQFGEVERLRARYGDRVEVLGVYVREAHAADGAATEANRRAGIDVTQPRTTEERAEVAGRFCSVFRPGFPVLVDAIDDQVGTAYQGMPNRLYLIDRDGRVAYRSGPGPVGFKVGELEQSLALLLEDQAARPAVGAYVPVPALDRAWAALPRAAQGGGQPLPTWARILAPALPRTTAALLGLDRVHRARSPLGPILAGRVRWAAADANRSAYGLAVAEADLRRAGLDAAAVSALGGDQAGLPETDRAAIAFARRLTLEADAVTDAEVEDLKTALGEEKLTALVLLLAYANFQDRLLLSLGVEVEPGGPLPPVEVAFDPGAPAPEPAPRVTPDPALAPPVPSRVDDAEWLALDLDDLRAGLKDQRERPGRIRVPTMEEVARRAPAAVRARGEVPSAWGRVCMAYQPELAAAWTACMRAFRAETDLDKVVQDSLFWVVTRTIHCFY